jgi:hypothetical protein
MRPANIARLREESRSGHLIVEPAEEGAEPARGEDDVPENGEPATEGSRAAEQNLSPPAQFRMECVPGYFPVRCRRVRVES